MGQVPQAQDQTPIPLESAAELFLRMDTIRTVGSTGTVFVFDAHRADPDALTAAALRELVSANLDKLPALRRRLVTIPGGGGRHGWVDQGPPTLDGLIAETDVGGEAGIRELCAEVSRLHARPLPRSRPLWQMHVIRGMAAGRVAVVFRNHHAIGDAAVTRVMKDVLFGAGPAPPEPPPAARPAIEPSEPQVELALQPVPVTRFNRMLCGERDLVLASAATPRLLRLKDAARLTFAGVLSAAVAGGLRAWLVVRGEAPAAPLMCHLPASTRTSGEVADAGNSLLSLWLPLPADEPDRGARIDRVRDGLAAAKRRAQSHPLERPERMNLSLSIFANTPRALEWLGAPLEANYGFGLIGSSGLSILCSSRPDLTCFGIHVDRQQGEGGWSLMEAVLEELTAIEHDVI